jgi:PKHD-type hydroxylase
MCAVINTRNSPAADPCHHVSVQLFTEVECNTIVELARGLPREPGEVEVHNRWRVSPLVRKAAVTWLENVHSTQWIFVRLAQLIADLNEERWHYKLSRLAQLQFTEYARFGHYVWHTDVGPGRNATRKLSFSVQLTPSHHYLGGRLQLHRGNYVLSASRNIGACTLFPSFALHRVTPVLAGTRLALVGWAHGVQPLQ